MVLQSADIFNFKNIANARIEFSPKVNCVLGRNGMGKSNLLEAVHYLSFVRGFRSMPDSAYLRHGEDSMLVKGIYLADDGSTDEVSCGMVQGRRKTVKRDGKSYGRLSEHIGRYPLVVAAPQDVMLVNGSGDDRRRFMDMVISQCDPLYLPALNRYLRSLESRNRMLRSGIRDTLLYESVEAPLCEAAMQLHAMRKDWTEKLQPVFNRYYEAVSGGQEKVALVYRSRLEECDMKSLLRETRAKDTVLGYTSAGAHRDDLDTFLGDYSMKRLGSQGQIKTYVIALKLAVYEYLKSNRGITPLLLLDDIFDKLDATRVERIMNVVGPGSDFGQIFVTDTNREHLDRILSGMDEHLLLEADHGAFTVISEHRADGTAKAVPAEEAKRAE